MKLVWYIVRPFSWLSAGASSYGSEKQAVVEKPALWNCGTAAACEAVRLRALLERGGEAMMGSVMSVRTAMGVK
jgi:hypothetical protein